MSHFGYIFSNLAICGHFGTFFSFWLFWFIWGTHCHFDHSLLFGLLLISFLVPFWKTRSTTQLLTLEYRYTVMIIITSLPCWRQQCQLRPAAGASRNPSIWGDCRCHLFQIDRLPTAKAFFWWHEHLNFRLVVQIDGRNSESEERQTVWPRRMWSDCQSNDFDKVQWYQRIWSKISRLSTRV